jgi:MFS family permease
MLPGVGNFFKTTFRSLQYRNFRLFWVGQCISLTGTWVQRTAQTWLVYSVTNSPLKVGLVGVAQFLPLLFLSLFAGVVVDRFPKQKLLVLTQALFLLQAVAMTLLTWSGVIQYWHILLLSFLFGLTQTLDMPARQSFFIDLVGRENVTNAISLNSTIVNLARIIGPALSGVLMAQLGVATCFFINSVSYIPVIAGLLMIRPNENHAVAVRRSANMLPEIADGMRYIRRSKVLVANVFIMAAVCTFAFNNDVVIPVFAREYLGRGVDGYSVLLSAAGVGAFCAAILMAYRSGMGVSKRLLVISGVAIGLLQVSTAFTRQYAVSLVLVALIGFFNLIFLNTANSIFQVSSANEYRGRVMSVYSFLNMGSTPIGNFLVGAVMENAGGDSGYLFCGGVTLALLTVIFCFTRREIARWFSKKPN